MDNDNNLLLVKDVKGAVPLCFGSFCSSYFMIRITKNPKKSGFLQFFGGFFGFVCSEARKKKSGSRKNWRKTGENPDPDLRVASLLLVYMLNFIIHYLTIIGMNVHRKSESTGWKLGFTAQNHNFSIRTSIMFIVK